MKSCNYSLICKIWKTECKSCATTHFDWVISLLKCFSLQAKACQCKKWCSLFVWKKDLEQKSISVTPLFHLFELITKTNQKPWIWFSGYKRTFYSGDDCETIFTAESCYLYTEIFSILEYLLEIYVIVIIPGLCCPCCTASSQTEQTTWGNKK